MPACCILSPFLYPLLSSLVILPLCVENPDGQKVTGSSLVLFLMPSEWWQGFAPLHHPQSMHSAQTWRQAGKATAVVEKHHLPLSKWSKHSFIGKEQALWIHVIKTRYYGQSKMMCYIFPVAFHTGLNLYEDLNPSLHQTQLLICLPTLALRERRGKGFRVSPSSASQGHHAWSNSSSAIYIEDWSLFPHLWSRDKN